MPTYSITPQDILFFRDGRPMTANAGSGGHGARWPEPSILFDALHAALHRAFPEMERKPDGTLLWEHAHRFGRSGNRDLNRPSQYRFGSLATFGPFPVSDGSWFFPRPSDVTRRWIAKATLAPSSDTTGATNLPYPFLRPVLSQVEPDKEGPHPWWNKDAIENYLASQSAGTPLQLADADLFGSEWNTGIAIDPDTQTTGHGEASGKIYAAQYLRLREGVTLGVHAQMPTKNGQPGRFIEALKQLFPASRVLICGGQQRACQVEEVPKDGLESVLPRSAAIAGERVKWVLLSPAVFPAIAGKDKAGNPKKDREGRPLMDHPGGWLPNWIDPSTGRVLLKRGDTRRGARSREDWRKYIQTLAPFDCHLVAACVPKPISLTGWSDRLHLLDESLEEDSMRKSKGARGTCLAVPAGAVYYFEGKDAPALADALSWHGSNEENPNRDCIVNRRSTLMGEKGFGLGVCGPWDYLD